MNSVVVVGKLLASEEKDCRLEERRRHLADVCSGGRGERWIQRYGKMWGFFLKVK